LLFIMLAAVSWGTVGVTSKLLYASSTTTPFSIGFLRLAVAVPALLVAGWGNTHGRLTLLSRRDLALVCVIGTMTALYQVCYFSAIPRLGVASATLITICSAPVIVATLSALLLRERPTFRTFAALTIAVVGTALLVGMDRGSGGAGSALSGTLLALASSVGYAVVTLCSRRLSTRCHPVQALTLGFAIGALLLLAATLPGGPRLSYSPRGWALVAYLGIVPTALAYVLFVSGLRSVPSTAATIATLLEPLTSTALACLFLGERLGRLGAWGGVLLGAAMVMLVLDTRRPASSE
jgi:DME family drug/metabolite transporter